jgi:hypothetical protein
LSLLDSFSQDIKKSQAAVKTFIRQIENLKNNTMMTIYIFKSEEILNMLSLAVETLTKRSDHFG